MIWDYMRRARLYGEFLRVLWACHCSPGMTLMAGRHLTMLDEAMMTFLTCLNNEQYFDRRAIALD